MPLYEFQCNDCETLFEEKRSFAHADAPAPCPLCASPNSIKVINASLFFKKGDVSERLNAQVNPLGIHSAGCSCCAPRRR